MTKKSVLITGASRGIGRACAIYFARAGYHVFINSRQSIDALTDLQNELLSEQLSCSIAAGDVGDPNQVRAIFEQIRTECDGIDILINNAGISYVGLLIDMSDDDWNSILQTNLSSAFYCSREAVPYMISKKCGKIINISSMWGRVGASCEVAYSTTKAGMNGLTMALAKELAPSNIQVNAIACGMINTTLNACFSDEEKLAFREEIPASRFGEPGEVAALALDLAQNHNYLTGQIIGLDGGYI